MQTQWPVEIAARICPVFRFITGFTAEQIHAGLTVPACFPVADPPSAFWGGPRRRLTPQGLQNVARLAAWTTPAASDGERGGVLTETMSGTSLTQLAAWATPASRDYRHPNARSYQERSGTTKGEQLSNQVAHSGPAPNGSSAATARRGVLNPRFSLWLMGYPEEWANCAPAETRSSRRSRRGS